ncbi:TraB/GumN family protein [Marinicella sp. S1101]|uniref:TraB/GumN family protein n=1 Tax=Marinicella marina TaxID=2996016 RepID=UPI002260D154|nr:TraB/GumN family protein [Marinicella marina]MCX7555149.1 TraB/GumN family protein [Marinicella marina]MDJ1141410.1 TraB/GumN family protein [Marinicella marina]
MGFIKITVLILVLWNEFSFAQVSQSALEEKQSAPPSNYAHSVLWKVTGNGLEQPSYVFGNWHFLCRNEIIFKNKVKRAIIETDQLLLQNFITYLSDDDYYADLAANEDMERGVPIYKIEDRKKRKKLLKLISSHLDLKVNLAKRVKPVVKRMTAFEVFFASMHSFINDCNRLGSFDQLLFDHYSKKNSQIGSVNDRKLFEQSILASGFVSPESLIMYIEDIESQRSLVKEMKFNYYRDERLDELMKLYRIFLTNDYVDAQRVDRYVFGMDIKPWVQVMVEWMQEAPTFISINASYMVGEGGVLAFLADQGYQLEPILE